MAAPRKSNKKPSEPVEKAPSPESRKPRRSRGSRRKRVAPHEPTIEDAIVAASTEPLEPAESESESESASEAKETAPPPPPEVEIEASGKSVLEVVPIRLPDADGSSLVVFRPREVSPVRRYLLRECFE